MWATPEQTVESWPDAADLPGGHVTLVLNAAQEQCQAYAPARPDGFVVPNGWTLAVIYQAREIHLASRRVGNSQAIGDAGYAIKVPPLTDAIKALLRPRRGIPEIGGPTPLNTETTYLDGGAP